MDGGEGSTGRGGGGGAVPNYDDDNYSEDNMYQDNDYDYDDDYDNYEEVNDGESGDHDVSESQNNDNNKDVKKILLHVDQGEINKNNSNKLDNVICKDNGNSVKIIENENIVSKDATEERSSVHIETNDDAPKNIPLKKNIKMKKKVLLTRAQKHRKMTEALCDVLGDFGLVSFLPMNIQDAQVCVCSIGLYWFGLGWVGLDWIGLDWISPCCIILFAYFRPSPEWPLYSFLSLMLVLPFLAYPLPSPSLLSFTHSTHHLSHAFPLI
jgi:hypothetical protein